MTNLFLYIASKKWVFQSHRRVRFTTGDVHAFFNAKRVFACILFCSWPCFSFSFDACAFVGTMIANLAIVIQNLPRTQKMFNLLGFTHVFDMGISLFLWYLLWHCLCTPKFYPKYFYPKYSKFFFLSTPVGLKSGIFYVGDHDYTYIHTLHYTTLRYVTLRYVTLHYIHYVYIEINGGMDNGISISHISIFPPDTCAPHRRSAARSAPHPAVPAASPRRWGAAGPSTRHRPQVKRWVESHCMVPRFSWKFLTQKSSKIYGFVWRSWMLEGISKPQKRNRLVFVWLHWTGNDWNLANWQWKMEWFKEK